MLKDCAYSVNSLFVQGAINCVQSTPNFIVQENINITPGVQTVSYTKVVQSFKQTMSTVFLRESDPLMSNLYPLSTVPIINNTKGKLKKGNN